MSANAHDPMGHEYPEHSRSAEENLSPNWLITLSKIIEVLTRVVSTLEKTSVSESHSSSASRSMS
jgi:hypothetical protein